MKSRLAFASVFTLGLLLAFVGTVVLLVMYFTHRIDAIGLVALTIFVNIVSWLVSPFIQDLILRWFYACQTLDWSTFRNDQPQVAAALEQICQRKKMTLPRLRLIDDGNPTAYCFGSGAWNARMVFTRGLFRYLDSDEVTAVLAHELGHISNGDFVVMTLAATLLTVLYEAYAILARGGGRGKSEARSRLVWIGYVSYALYLVGTYIVLYLSRTREYLADRFSAFETRNPNALAMGLVKVAYGIVAAPDSEKSKRLLASTRSLGPCDYKAAGTAGSAYARFMTGGTAVAVASPAGTAAAPMPERLERVFLFDLFNPWAAIGEINSTHPLTGKRIRRLMEYCTELGVAPRFDFSLAEYEGQMLDRGRMRGNFAKEVLIYFAGWLGFGLGILVALFSPPGPALIAPLLGIGLGWCVQGLYCFPPGKAEPTNVFELMCDPYASPVRGRLVFLQGQVVGRASAGSPIGEDMVFQDVSGLITLNYESPVPAVGNWWFGWRRMKGLMGQPASAIGWFRRYTRSYVDLNRLNALSGTINSYTRFWGIWKGPVFIVLALLIMLALR